MALRGVKKGYKQTEEHKKKRSEKLVGRHCSLKTEFKKGHLTNKGRKHSEEFKRKLSETKKGQILIT